MGAERPPRSPFELVERLRSLSILPGRRMCGLRTVLGEEGILIYRSEHGGQVRIALGNVQRCGRRECPVCGPIAAKATYTDIRRAAHYLHEADAWLYMATLTVAHGPGDPADRVWDAVDRGLKRILSGADRQADWDELAIIGQWVRIENRSTRAGHHIHAHVLVWTERQLAEPEELLRRWFPRWKAGAMAAGLAREPGLPLQHVTPIEYPDAVAHYVAKAEEAIANELAATEVKRGHRRDSRSQVDLALWAVDAVAAQAKETGTRFRLPMTKHQRARLHDGRIEIQSGVGLVHLLEDRDEAVLEETEQLTADLAFLETLVRDLEEERREAIEVRRATLLHDLAEEERADHPHEPHLVRFELRSMIARQPVEEADAEINEAGRTRAAELRATRRLRDDTRAALLQLGPRKGHPETGEVVAPDERGQHYRWVPIEKYTDGPIPEPLQRMWEAELAAHGRRRVRRSQVQQVADGDRSGWARRRRLWNAAIEASKSEEALATALYTLEGRRWANAEESGALEKAEREWEHATVRRSCEVDRRYAHRYAVLLPIESGAPMRLLDARAVDEIRAAAAREPADLVAVAVRHGFEAIPARRMDAWPAPRARLLKSYVYIPNAGGAPRWRARAAAPDPPWNRQHWPPEAEPPLPQGFRILTIEEQSCLLSWRMSWGQPERPSRSRK